MEPIIPSTPAHLVATVDRLSAAGGRVLARRPRLLGLLVLTWLVAVGAGLAITQRYAGTPGRAATPPARWPAASRIVADSAVPTLVMTVHPQCPCSRASLEELDRLMAHAEGRVAAYVLVMQPSARADDWARTDLWHRAAAIRGVTVLADEDGIEARRFDASTSGQTMLYAADGRLLFSGGITESRGHAGDNLGLSALGALLGDRDTTTRRTPVFGCSLTGTQQRGT